MDDSNLIYDWNSVDYEYHRNHQNHPHGIWFDDETLRDGLQSPSARNPTIEQKLELVRLYGKTWHPKSGSWFARCRTFPSEHIDAMLKHITENDYNIRPGCAVRTLQVDIEPLVDLQAKYEIEIQASAFLGTEPNSSICRGMDDGKTDENNGKCSYICRRS